MFTLTNSVLVHDGMSRLSIVESSTIDGIMTSISSLSSTMYIHDELPSAVHK
jgi:hypothetical protein